ncbi:unnamed protein product, partial [Musa textilis]
MMKNVILLHPHRQEAFNLHNLKFPSWHNLHINYTTSNLAFIYMYSDVIYIYIYIYILLLQALSTMMPPIHNRFGLKLRS